MSKGKATLAAASKSIDPTLDALFSTSSGPVKAPPKSRYTAPAPPKHRSSRSTSDSSGSSSDQDDDVEATDDIEEDTSGDSDEQESSTEESSDQESSIPAKTPKKERKRKRDDGDDLESRYLSKLVDDDDDEPVEKKLKEDTGNTEEDASSEASDQEQLPTHESLATDPKASDIEKANRTIFLSNVSAEAITSKSAKKTLLAHLSTVLDQSASPPQKIESMRFRSVAFAGSSMPKRASYITKSLMDATTRSTNAYVVYSSPAAARKATLELNGTEVLGRHVRVDSVAHPGAIDHRRCVFVGNLGFVDDETVLNTDADGETTSKKRTKVPADVEEGLWRTFGEHAGKVENVRVVRDPKTRVGKGFAYVQFYDINDVEGALLLDGKKYPPMLPRQLRVTRAKAPHKTTLAMERKAKGAAAAGTNTNKSTKYKPKATSEEQSMAGRVGKLLGRSGAALHRKGPKPQVGNGSGVIPKGMKTPEQIVFEGRRATKRDALPRDLKGKKPKTKGKRRVEKSRGQRRAAEWRKKAASAKS